ncbi:ABC transporter ATP-binding protein [Piscibacillus halophilus]|uniref:Phosphate ABC transporter ATP-binding protein, PhoT family n=1 Tax=Piscibacillus halophilus TaxID=571933 RepID=A0A1H9MBJ6_9BACI|nr:phosphate ABC transporter ATP-binding protein [Piscibacillus halophilus]SER21130.1 phosphate ABC transporter ATP-binding protein, PhoT family [Piscibacillus halophilus]
MQKPLFELKGVYKRILKNINLEIYKGDRVMLFGPSGSGKSTLLHLFNRLHDPEKGNIYYNGDSIDNYDIPKLRKNIGLVLQQPHLFPETVEDNLKYGPSLFEEWEQEWVNQLLDYVNLPKSYLKKSVDELSGGEKQRVSLARTLANKPEVLLLDEPTSALDDQNIERIEEVLMRLITTKDLTVIMVTHNIEQAKRLGTKGIFLQNGGVREEGLLPQMLDRPKTEELKKFTTNI